MNDKISGQLTDSHLLSFIDNSQSYVVTFLEGQKLIHDIVLKQPKIRGELGLYRQAVLGFQHFVHFFKANEQLGFYFEAENNAFSFKLESNPQGHTRCVIVNNSDKETLPAKWSGIARFMISYPQLKKDPVQSVIQVSGNTVPEIFNLMLKNAMQIEAVISIPESSDQSIMITRLPDLGGKAAQPIAGSLCDFLTHHQQFFDNLWNKALTDPEALKSKIEARGFKLLRKVPVAFHCPCSYERMLANVALLWQRSEPELFADTGSLEITCDFCSSSYSVSQTAAKEYLKSMTKAD